jgi:hypothetical protein
VHGLASLMDERGKRVRREVIVLVVLVLAVDALFVAGYFAAGLARASTVVKIVYTGVWTLATLVVVLRALTRIRTIRARPPR